MFNVKKHVKKPTRNGKKSKVYWVDFRTITKKRIQCSLKTNDRNIAEREARILYEKYNKVAPKIIETDKNISFGEILDYYFTTKSGLREITLHHYRSLRTIICKRFDEKMKANQITDNLIFSYQSDMCSEGINQYTVYDRLKFLRAIFSWAVKGKLILTNPLMNIQLSTPEGGKGRHFSRAQYELIMSKISNRHKDIVLCLFHTGMRNNEVRSMRWSWVDFEKDEIHLPAADGEFQSKTNKGRDIPITSQLKEALLRRRAISAYPETGYVFSPDGGSRKYNDLHQNFFASFLKKLNIKGKCLHSTRHTYATFFLEKFPGQFEQLMRIGGWNNVKTVLRYAHDTEDQRKARLEKVQALFDELDKKAC